MPWYRTATLLAAVLACAVPGVLAAQATRETAGGATPQVTRQLQQLAGERAALQAENATLKKELEALKGRLAGATAEQANLRQRAAGTDAAVAAARAAREELEAEAARRRTREEELVAEFRKTIDTLREVEADRGRLADEARVAGADLQRCTKSSVELADIALEVLARYEDAGFGHAFARAEPFTRLSRTRVENLVDEYRARVEALKPAGAAAGERASP